MRLFIALWIGTAAVCVVLTAIETINRSRRAHGSLATEMLQSALEQFLPAIVAGGLLTIVLLAVAPQDLWMLPGIWHIVFSLGVLLPSLSATSYIRGRRMVSGLRSSLPRSRSADPHNSPWAMGIPYGVGHLLVAGILQQRRQLERYR